MRQLFVMLIWVLMGAAAFGAVPQLINYQGQLTNSSGFALDTTVAMTFKLYSDTTQPALWVESHPAVAVQKGLFNVSLGESSPLTTTILNNAPVWLGIAVGSDAMMTPRQQVMSVAYAYRVGTVDGATGGAISGKLNVGTGNTNGGWNANVHGQNNQARSDYSVISGGGGANLADSNSTTGTQAAIGGGVRNSASGVLSTVAGGYWNSTSNAFATVSGGGLNVSNGNSSAVGGGAYNVASGGAATVAGGNSNHALSENSAIAGGANNSTTGSGAVVAGGYNNHASGNYSVISGGGSPTAVDSNSASGQGSAIGGGTHNNVTGLYSTIPGGQFNTVSGSNAFAAGINATASHNSAFVWGASSTLSPTASFNTNTFTARCENGARFYTASSGTTVGVQLPAGGGAWSNLCDARQKNFYGDPNTSDILNKVLSLPLHRWSYKTQSDNIQHIGPTAQDFYAAFQVGDNNTTISTIDPSGVALAAIQELAKRLNSVEAENAALRAQVQSLAAGTQHSMAEGN
jgi:hypothetical protein